VTHDPIPPVDPVDVQQVAEVLSRTLELMGPEGVGDLLARLPGARPVPATAGRLFRPAVTGSVWLGADHQLVLGDPVVHQHVVGGVVLQRRALTPTDLGPTVAQLVADLVRSQGAREEAATVLTVARDVVRSL
jgi:hypothetical protein